MFVNSAEQGTARPVLCMKDSPSPDDSRQIVISSAIWTQVEQNAGVICDFQPANSSTATQRLMARELRC